MWQDVFASLLVLFGAQGFGVALCQDMKRTQYHLQQQKRLMTYIIKEIDYIQRPLCEILEEHEARLGEPYRGFVKEVASQMKQEDGRSIQQIWRGEVSKNIKNRCYPTEAIEMLERIGESLGCQEEHLQLSVMKMVENELDEKMEWIKKEKDEKSKLIQTLSLLTGVLCVVLFL